MGPQQIRPCRFPCSESRQPRPLRRVVITVVHASRTARSSAGATTGQAKWEPRGTVSVGMANSTLGPVPAGSAEIKSLKPFAITSSPRRNAQARGSGVIAVKNGESIWPAVSSRCLTALSGKPRRNSTCEVHRNGALTKRVRMEPICAVKNLPIQIAQTASRPLRRYGPSLRSQGLGASVRPRTGGTPTALQ